MNDTARHEIPETFLCDDAEVGAATAHAEHAPSPLPRLQLATWSGATKQEARKPRGIEWRDYSFNPWIGCQRVSPACEHCYAEAMAKRWWGVEWGPTAARKITSDENWRKPLGWNSKALAAGERPRVFCASVSDVFEDRRDLDLSRERLWDLVRATTSLDWLLLTKRPQHVGRMAPWREDWPAHVWLGTTVEDQRRAEERLPHLIEHPAAVRFLSVEPLLGPLDLRPWLSHVDWVIVGGESGPGARPMEIAWARAVRDQCIEMGVPLFFKQWGPHSPDATGEQLIRLRKKGDRLFDGKIWNEYPQPKIRGLLATHPPPRSSGIQLASLDRGEALASSSDDAAVTPASPQTGTRSDLSAASATSPSAEPESVPKRSFVELVRQLGKNVNEIENALLCMEAFTAYLVEYPNTARGKANTKGRDASVKAFRIASAKEAGCSPATIDKLLRKGKALAPLPPATLACLKTSPLASSVRLLNLACRADVTPETRETLCQEYVKEAAADAPSARRRFEQALGVERKEHTKAKRETPEPFTLSAGESHMIKLSANSYVEITVEKIGDNGDVALRAIRMAVKKVTHAEAKLACA